LEYILQGLLLGLTLSILLGPIFIALTQTSIEKGLRGGFFVGLGIWFSDILVILSSYFFIYQVELLINDYSFQFWMGLVGGFILIVTGIVSIINKPASKYEVKGFKAKNVIGLLSKGFAVNFFNPFTFLFWLGIMSTYVIGKGINGKETILLFGTILLTVIFTDSLKVLSAKWIAKKMKDSHIQKFIRVAGVLLIVFGVLLIGRVSRF